MRLRPEWATKRRRESVKPIDRCESCNRAIQMTLCIVLGLVKGMGGDKSDEFHPVSPTNMFTPTFLVADMQTVMQSDSSGLGRLYCRIDTSVPHLI